MGKQCLGALGAGSIFGCISATANIHAPNEHLAVSSYLDEIKMIAGVMDALGKM